MRVRTWVGADQPSRKGPGRTSGLKKKGTFRSNTRLSRPPNDHALPHLAPAGMADLIGLHTASEPELAQSPREKFQREKFQREEPLPSSLTCLRARGRSSHLTAIPTTI